MEFTNATYHEVHVLIFKGNIPNGGISNFGTIIIKGWFPTAE